jgi:hypothetical protein
MLTCADVSDCQDLWIGMPGCHDSRIVKERKPRVLNEANTEITTWNNKNFLIIWQYKDKIITRTLQDILTNSKLSFANLVCLMTIFFAAIIYQMMSKARLQRALNQEIYSRNMFGRSFD